MSLHLWSERSMSELTDMHFMSSCVIFLRNCCPLLAWKSLYIRHSVLFMSKQAFLHVWCPAFTSACPREMLPLSRHNETLRPVCLVSYDTMYNRSLKEAPLSTCLYSRVCERERSVYVQAYCVTDKLVIFAPVHLCLLRVTYRVCVCVLSCNTMKQSWAPVQRWTWSFPRH